MLKFTVAALGAVAAVLGVSLAPTAASPPRAAAPALASVPLEFSRIYWEYNSSANDLGVHVTLDGEDWTSLRIRNPNGKLLFDVRGSGPYKQLGMTELFFEGAEPSLDEFPLQDLLDLFPEGEYDFEGVTVDGAVIEGDWQFTHAIPAGPVVSAEVGANNLIRIHWTPVAGPPAGFPAEPIVITGYQVLVDPFQVTVPANVNVVTLPPEFVASLPPGQYPFEVLAIEASTNQSITEGSFVK